ncbi:MAG: glycosyltransferase [Candidatus Portnoybacteria bacterium CG10_big_fil_rev_8_21_14_0_10_44_7]|uniref:Glycosyltransferase n=1 Tax=Candidatus Portnoybacteria bacterium CG10_big_fil_rev_8_21_14_0_10_44_7 TaxID=1974816 RepID=A0A2M8KJ35_9BACT|nr:MAG: glycosyltransferase [Candidatus Portnoybacteria bacterium CG10_big_fil_rev_8_21_14_0_10_44_7]
MRVLGVKIDNLTVKQIGEKIEEFLLAGQHQVVLPYSLFLLRAQKDKKFRNILNQAALSVADGFGPVLAARLVSGQKLKRFLGVDFVRLLCQIAQATESGVFLFGGQPHVAARAARVLQRQFANLPIVGTCRGFDLDENYVINYVNNSGAEILIVALGMPKQEKWIARNLIKMPKVKIAVGVGGAFDFISGRTKRAPWWLRRSGLEWLFRLIIQPWRIKKIFRAVFGLTWLILRSKLKTKSENIKIAT